MQYREQSNKHFSGLSGSAGGPQMSHITVDVFSQAKCTLFVIYHYKCYNSAAGL